MEWPNTPDQEECTELSSGDQRPHLGSPPPKCLTSGWLVLLSEPQFPHSLSPLEGIQRQADLEKSLLAEVLTEASAFNGEDSRRWVMERLSLEWLSSPQLPSVVWKDVCRDHSPKKREG